MTPSGSSTPALSPSVGERMENYQWDLPDGSGRFYVPDIAFIHPGATTAEEERTAIVLVVEVTSPTSPDTVANDRTTETVQYAKAGVPLYLLVDQELGRWTLFGLAEGWQRVSDGGRRRLRRGDQPARATQFQPHHSGLAALEVESPLPFRW